MRRKIHNASAGKQTLDRAIIRPVPRLEKLAQLTDQFASGVVGAFFDTGNYVYYGHQIGIRSTVSIAGKTNDVDGVHWVKPENLHEFIADVEVQIDTRRVSKISVQDLQRMNLYKGLASDNCVHITHGGPGEFTAGLRDYDFEDWYALGTGGVTDYRIWFQLTSDWDSATMSLDVVSEYSRATKRPGALFTYETIEAIAPGSGVFTFSDLPTYTDISRIIVTAAGMTDAELIVDGETLVSGSIASINDNLKKFGRDASAFPDSFVVDMLRTGDPRHILKSLEHRDQVKRNAQIKAKLTLTGTNTPVQFLIERAGPLNQQG